MDLTEKYLFKGIVLNSILKDMSIEGRRRMLCRRSHGFIIKLKGSTEYCFGDKTKRLSQGQVLFVEKGSSYYIKEIEPGYSYVVNFDAFSVPGLGMKRLSFPEGFEIAPLAEKMYRFSQKGSFYGALSCLYSLLDKTVSSSDCYLTVRDRQILEPVEAYLSSHLTDVELCMEDMKGISGVSDAYLRRIFKKRYGISPSGYVIRERISLACNMLLSGEEQSVARIAYTVGYRDPLYFSRIFKKQIGVSPTDYKNEHMEDTF